jgi:integrase/recombinase XerC
MASSSLLHFSTQFKSVLNPKKQIGVRPVPNKSIRRVFSNEQLIERFGKWLEVCGKAANTRLVYILAARQFTKFISGKPITAVMKSDVSAFLATLYSNGLSPFSMQTKLDSLRVFFDFLALGGLVSASAPRFIARRKLPTRLPEVISEEEIERLIAAAHKPRDKAIIELKYASGLRVNELAMLRVPDVNLKALSVVVRQGKGGDDRLALFGRKAAEALREYLGQRQTGRVFLSEPQQQRGGITRGKGGDWWGQWRERDATGKLVMRSVRLGNYDIPNRERAREALSSLLAGRIATNYRRSPESLTARSIHRIIVAIAKRAGIEVMHPHVLRHSMATHCLNRGMNIRVVQELLGHKSLMATQKYLHVSTQRIQEVHAKFHPHGGQQ